MSRNSVIVQEKEVKVVNQELDLSDLNINSISDISGLDELEIVKLTLNNNNITDINDLPNLPNLSVLNLSGNKIQEIQGLGRLPNLKYLDLSWNHIQLIQGLHTLLNLEVLILNNNEIQEIQGLNTMKYLKELHLNGNQIRVIQGLESLKNLEILFLNNNHIQEIGDSLVFSLLEYLNLSWNHIQVIPELNSVQNLKVLDFNNNNIQEIKNLGEIPNLNYLFLNHNQIQEIKGLDALTDLKVLYLNHNQIQEIKELDALTDLKVLHLNHNQIQEIKGLDPLILLKELNLSDNKIQEIKGLDPLILLEELNLSDNKIPEIKGLDALTNLIFLELNGNKINEIKGIEKNNNLNKIFFLNNPMNYLERILINEPIERIQEHCRNKKNQTNIIQLKIAKYHENLQLNTISDEDIYNIGTYREDRGLKEIQNLVFLEEKPNSIILTENGCLKKTNIYIIQLHEIPNEYGFQPRQSKMAHFKTFANIFWDIDEGALRYKKLEKLTNTENKLQKMLMQIFQDEGENKIIIFPENSVPFDKIEEIKEMANKQSQKNQNHIVIVGGCEHIKKTLPIEQGESSYSNKYRFLKKRRIKNFNPETFEGFKKDCSKPINGYLNQAFIIDGNKLGWQMKQTPVVLHDKDTNEELREPIDCIKEPNINIFDTSLGRIAIFICKDFLRLEQVVAEWGKRNKVNFIVVPSNTSKILPFIYRLHRILNEEYQPTIQIIYANVGEYGGSDLFSIDLLPEIEKSYQHNQRDNVGEVIVKRIFNPDKSKEE